MVDGAVVFDVVMLRGLVLSSLIDCGLAKEVGVDAGTFSSRVDVGLVLEEEAVAVFLLAVVLFEVSGALLFTEIVPCFSAGLL